MEKELDNVLDRFPQHRKNIIRLYSSNADFKALSTDYLQCTGMLLKFKQHLIVADIRMENEYKTLCLALEQEILHFLIIPVKK